MFNWVVVSQQDEKSQHKNKAKALKICARGSMAEKEKRSKDQAIEEVKLDPEIDQKNKNIQFSSRASYRSSY